MGKVGKKIISQNSSPEVLYHNTPCREVQFNMLLKLIGNARDLVPECLFLYGHTSTGKTLVVSEFLKFTKYQHAIVNCIECQTPKFLFECILNLLSGYKLNSSNNFSPYMKCDYMMDFITNVKKVYKHSSNGSRCIIVLDNCERLRDMDSTILPALLRLQELTMLKGICVILLSDVVWEKFNTKHGLISPIKIFFPQYTKVELLQILMLDKPVNCPKDFYNNYLNVLYQVLGRACRDLNEFRHMIKINLKIFLTPDISKGSCRENMKLFQNIIAHLKTLMEDIYLRSSNSINSDSNAMVLGELTSSRKYALSFELPYYSKFFLIAAYLASYNPASEDQRLFVKSHGKQKKRSRVMRKQKLKNVLLGPKAFSVDRLLAIFYSILEEQTNLTINLMTQIQSLVKMQLLSVVGEHRLNAPKYRCTVSLDFVQIIAKTVDFNIIKYLHDFH